MICNFAGGLRCCPERRGALSVIGPKSGPVAVVLGDGSSEYVNVLAGGTDADDAACCCLARLLCTLGRIQKG